ncbi:hypothetical protein GUJ93_ZPchr0010g7588 [Zizania palustris]|uniref:Uncharacterized protein n=1 Tax=Zizania palustris TaxID=103762 RepID=A0A8J5W7B0_ZIZPA|nr:hypothetical protein GUJ93_ZPchr0010g7588 [Zizania palustris]
MQRAECCECILLTDAVRKILAADGVKGLYKASARPWRAVSRQTPPASWHLSSPPSLADAIRNGDGGGGGSNSDSPTSPPTDRFLSFLVPRLCCINARRNLLFDTAPRCTLTTTGAVDLALPMSSSCSSCPCIYTSASHVDETRRSRNSYNLPLP